MPFVPALLLAGELPLMFALLLILGGLALYFVPIIVAHSRKVERTGGIIALNLLLGWTFLGWVAALIWACSAETVFQAQMRQMAYAQMAGAPRSASEQG